MKIKASRLTHFIILTSFLLLFACSKSEKPPFLKALITDAAGNQATVHNFKLLYWWEERNETPYLKPHRFYTKKLVVEVMEPINNNPKQVSISTRTLPLQTLSTLSIIPAATGYELNIKPKSGKNITATNRFPMSLKKNKDSGLADNLLYAYGHVFTNNGKKEFKKSFNILREIHIIEVMTAED